MDHRVTDVTDDLVTFETTYRSPRWTNPQLSRSTLRFLDAGSLATFLDGAGLPVTDQWGDWDRSPLTDASPEIITVANARLGVQRLDLL